VEQFCQVRAVVLAIVPSSDAIEPAPAIGMRAREEVGK
jgi:hypothetical protein